MKKRLMLIILIFVCISLAHGGFYYGRYWGMDAQTQWVQTTSWVTIPTGYWYGNYNYYYGGYNWGSYSGWYYPYSGYYYNHYGSSWGWGAPNWYYGFTDYYSYRATYTWPRTIYTWSRYWDPSAKGYTMDFYTELGENGQALSIGLADIDGQMRSISNVIEAGDHLWSYNGGDQEGAFTDLTWVVASPDAMQAYLTAQGFDAATIADILAEQILLDTFASNYDGASYGDNVIGVQWAEYIIPEPATVICLGLGSLLVLWRRKNK